jgi:hypothetical protein
LTTLHPFPQPGRTAGRGEAGLEVVVVDARGEQVLDLALVVVLERLARVAAQRPQDVNEDAAQGSQWGESIHLFVQTKACQRDVPSGMRFFMVPPGGFEPSTPALGERCSIP